MIRCDQRHVCMHVVSWSTVSCTFGTWYRGAVECARQRKEREKFKRPTSDTIAATSFYIIRYVLIYFDISFVRDFDAFCDIRIKLLNYYRLEIALNAQILRKFCTRCILAHFLDQKHSLRFGNQLQRY